MRILVVEDEKDLARIIQKKLNEENFAVDIAHDGEQAIDKTIAHDYDLIILDLMIQKKDGYEVLKELRDWHDDTMVLILTAKDQIEDKVKGLNMGADDYLTKPFAFPELTARIKTLLRREPREYSNILQTGDLRLDTNIYKVSRASKEIELTSKEYSLLEYLLRNKGYVLSRTQMEEHVWGYMGTNNSNIVDVYIRFLRRKIDEKFQVKLIETVRGKGYRIRQIEIENNEEK